MKNSYYILLFAILVSVGCADEFLDKAPQAKISTTGLASEEGIAGILVGAYKSLNGQGLDGQAPWENDIHNWVFGGIASDNAVKGTDAGDQPEQSFIEAYDLNSFNNHIKNKWRGVYKGVARANDVITAIQALQEGDNAMPQASADQMTAEARFIRGVMHLEAQKMWRNPVYVGDDVYNLNDVNSTKVPNTGPIWDKIEADFEAAASTLPATQSDVGRPTKWAAKAFLAKTMLSQGWPGGSANAGKLNSAKSLLLEVVNSGQFKLLDKYDDNFYVRTNNSEESIFEVQMEVSSASYGAGNTGIGLAHPYISPWGCCGFYQATQDLVNSFRTDAATGLPLLDDYNKDNVTDPLNGAVIDANQSFDARIDHSIGRPGILYKGHHIMQNDYIRDITYAGPYFMMKHVTEPEAFGVAGWGNISANNYRIMRLSMIYLWLAEIEVETGSLEKAREYVNLLRTRAANPAGFVPEAIQGASRAEYTTTSNPAANYNTGLYTAAWTDKNVARKAVRHESRMETAGEGHRFFDLQRWGVQNEVLTKYVNFEKQYRIYLNNANFESPKNEYYPIPQEAIDNSQLDGAATLTQDSNY